MGELGGRSSPHACRIAATTMDPPARPPHVSSSETMLIDGREDEEDRGMDVEANGKCEDPPGCSPEEDMVKTERLASTAPATYKDIFQSFALLGWTAFGGPGAHIGLFYRIFVETKNWITSSVFAELVALGQCMPGPTSTQMSFAIGVAKKGVKGGLLSGMLFQYPGLVMMAGLGVLAAARALDDPVPVVDGFADGLAAGGVALIWGAVKNLTEKMCTEWEGKLLCVVTAVIAFYYQTAWLFPTLIVCGGLFTIVSRWKKNVDVNDSDAHIDKFGLGIIGGGSLIALWVILLVLSIVLTNEISYDSSPPLHWFATFYETGSVIFGGGQVVLPLLLDRVVQTERVCLQSGESPPPRSTEIEGTGCYDVEKSDTWVTSKQFYAGLALAQAMPGPLFNFSAYLGSVMAYRAGDNFLVGVATCWLGLFGPGVMLIFGILPFWGKFRKFQLYRRALPGLNASAVGLILASAFTMTFRVRSESSFPDATICIGILAYAVANLLQPQQHLLKILLAPIAVICSGVLGIIAWATGMN